MSWIVGIYLLAAASGAGDPSAGPQQLSAQAGGQLLLSDVQRPPHKLTLTPDLAKHGLVYWGLYKICVDPQGQVAEVKVIRAATGRKATTPVPMNHLDQHWTQIVKGWRYRPHQVEGQARPFCYVANLEVDEPYVETDGRLTLPFDTGHDLLVSDVQKPPHQLTLPPALNRAGMVIWGLYKLCIGTTGEVTRVTKIKPAGNGLDDEWTKVMRSWRHKPYLVDDKPTAVCYVRRVEVRAPD
jgi:hypothetical protein